MDFEKTRANRARQQRMCLDPEISCPKLDYLPVVGIRLARARDTPPPLEHTNRRVLPGLLRNT